MEKTNKDNIINQAIQDTKEEAGFNIDEIINFDSIAPNSLICFRIDAQNLDQCTNIMNGIMTISKRYGQQIKSKNLSFIVLDKEMKIETLSEEKMGHLGWKKISEKRIITLN
jgi:ferredoxin-fold anticodon binding domain-containing protein